MKLLLLAPLGVLLLLAGCASARRADSADTSQTVSMEKGAIVLEGQALRDGPGSLLAAMKGKVPNLRVHYGQGQCPEISLRGYTSFEQVANPQVYVDGTLTSDTCILESLRTDDVERVEVYPQGFTTRPGYGTHAPGLILVFMRTAG